LISKTHNVLDKKIKDGEMRAQTHRHQASGEHHIRLPTELTEECREEDSVLFPSQQDSSHLTHAITNALTSRSYRMPNIEKSIIGNVQNKSGKNTFTLNKPRGLQNASAVDG
jgi:hypothetical protein